jgi:hypothetical protein
MRRGEFKDRSETHYVADVTPRFTQEGIEVICNVIWMSGASKRVAKSS